MLIDVEPSMPDDLSAAVVESPEEPTLLSAAVGPTVPAVAAAGHYFLLLGC